MFIYHWQLAWRSLKKNPILCGLMVLAIACGVTASMICYTAYHVINTNPLSNKDAILFMLQTDSWHLKEAFSGKASNQMPDLLSYRDVTALMHSHIPLRKTAMTRWGGILSIPNSEAEPYFAKARINTHDYFKMFDVDFLYGSPWNQAADNEVQNLIVLSEDVNNHFFRGENSIGKTILLEGYLYKIQGVLKRDAQPSNKMQNIDTSILMPTEDVYLPFGVLAEREISSWDIIQRPGDLLEYSENSHQNLLKSGNLWLSYWVEFSGPKQKQEYEQFISQYIQNQKALGYYPRSLRFALSNATQKLNINGYSNGKFSMLTKFGVGFLMVCTVNCIALLLAKFLRYAPESAIRRALGASRTAIFVQHFIESSIIGILGAALGLVLTYTGLKYLHYEFSNISAENNFLIGNIADLFVLDAHILLVTVMASIVASLCAGIYPAWRICQASIAQHLKLQ